MQNKFFFVLALLLAAFAAQAQTQTQTSPAKKELVSRILKTQQAAIETTARNLVEQPAVEMLGSAANALQSRVAKDKQDAVAKEIQADVRKFVDEAVPVVRERAVKLAPSTVGTLLEEKFTEDELKQIASMLESPVYAKFQNLGQDMQKALVEKVVADTRSIIEPKVRALEQTIAKRLGVTAAPAATPAPANTAPARAPAKPASK
jgi:hypothetical protein